VAPAEGTTAARSCASTRPFGAPSLNQTKHGACHIPGSAARGRRIPGPRMTRRNRRRTAPPPIRAAAQASMFTACTRRTVLRPFRCLRPRRSRRQHRARRRRPRRRRPRSHKHSESSRRPPPLLKSDARAPMAVNPKLVLSCDEPRRARDRPPFARRLPSVRRVS